MVMSHLSPTQEDEKKDFFVWFLINSREEGCDNTRLSSSEEVIIANSQPRNTSQKFCSICQPV